MVASEVRAGPLSGVTSVFERSQAKLAGVFFFSSSTRPENLFKAVKMPLAFVLNLFKE